MSENEFSFQFPVYFWGSFSQFKPSNLKLGGLAIVVGPEDYPKLSETSESVDPVFVLSGIHQLSSIPMQYISQLVAKGRRPLVVIYASGFSADVFLQFVHNESVFAIVEDEVSLTEKIQGALEEVERRRQYQIDMKRLREQNLAMENINENLEKLVHERTLSEFQESKNAEMSFRSTQHLLSFIKKIGRSESLEDLMECLRSDFKRFHGLLPPILFLSSGMKRGRVFYFQGKQLIEKSIDRADFGTSGEDELKVRNLLSNLLGRPFGPVALSSFRFQGEELASSSALMIFERSLENKKINAFEDFMGQCRPLINLALENLLIREGSQLIARQWSRTFNKMSDPILILDRSHGMSLSNGNFHRESGGLCYESFAGRSSPCPHCPIGETLNSEKPQVADLSLKNKVYRVHSYPIRLGPEEEATHVINQYVDVTSAIDLRSRVIQGEKMAAVGLLAGNIAHELNNPLTGIFSLSQLLLEELEENSNSHKDLVEIRDAAARCQRIIKDLLDFSEVGSPTKMKSIDVNQLIQRTLPLLKMATRNFRVNVELAEETLRTEGNPQLLQQVIFNLVNNACQAMGEEGSLEVFSARLGNQVQVKIRDTGPGIPDSVRDLIFDPFFTTKKEGQGTGLGLSLSKSVVEKMGGELSLNTDYTKGTEFIISLVREDHESTHSR